MDVDHRRARPHVTGREQRCAATRAGKRRAAEDRVERCDAVPVEPFRKAYLLQVRTGDTSPSILCRELGLMRPTWPAYRQRRPNAAHEVPDLTLLKRLLGIKPQCAGARSVTAPAPREFIPYETAERLCELLGLDPHTAGI